MADEGKYSAVWYERQNYDRLRRHSSKQHQLLTEAQDELANLLRFVSNVLTDSQLDHPVCGETCRDAITPATIILNKLSVYFEET